MYVVVIVSNLVTQPCPQTTTALPDVDQNFYAIQSQLAFFGCGCAWRANAGWANQFKLGAKDP